MSSHAGMPGLRSVRSQSGGMTPSSFWRANVSSRSASQPWSKRALVLVGPLVGHVVRRVGRAGREVGEERLVGHQRLLLAHPLDRVRRQVVVEVVALLRRLVGLDRRRALVERGIPLVGLAAEEAVEVLEAHPGRPLAVRAHRARLPDRDLVALAELRRAVAVELEDLGQRRGRVRPDRVVARRGGGELGDVAHADRVVVAAGEQRRAGRRAQRRGVEAVVLQPAGGEALEVRRVARAAERAGGAEADVVDQDDQDVRRARGGRSGTIGG